MLMYSLDVYSPSGLLEYIQPEASANTFVFPGMCTILKLKSERVSNHCAC